MINLIKEIDSKTFMRWFWYGGSEKLEFLQ